VAAILEQLGINSTFFVELAVFVILFGFLSRVYFAPFLKLLQERHARTVKDREAARAMLVQAEAKLQEYQGKIADARLRARADMEEAIRKGRAEEQAALTQARDEAKRITQAALAEADAERNRLKAAIETDAEGLAKLIVDQLMVKGGQL